MPVQDVILERPSKNDASFNKSLLFLHDHPRNSVFSERDLNSVLISDSIVMVTVVCNNGRRYYLTKNENYTLIKVLSAIDFPIIKITTEQLRKYFVDYQQENNCSKTTVYNVRYTEKAEKKGKPILILKVKDLALTDCTRINSDELWLQRL